MKEKELGASDHRKPYGVTLRRNQESMAIINSFISKTTKIKANKNRKLILHTIYVKNPKQTGSTNTAHKLLVRCSHFYAARTQKAAQYYTRGSFTDCGIERVNFHTYVQGRLIHLLINAEQYNVVNILAMN